MCGQTKVTMMKCLAKNTAQTRRIADKDVRQRSVKELFKAKELEAVKQLEDELIKEERLEKKRMLQKGWKAKK